MRSKDPRLQRHAYITDGSNLYEVLGDRVFPGVAGIRTRRIVVENCRSLLGSELLEDRVTSAFRLVRPAPARRCPDFVEEIAWEGLARPAPRASGGR